MREVELILRNQGASPGQGVKAVATTLTIKVALGQWHHASPAEKAESIERISEIIEGVSCMACVVNDVFGPAAAGRHPADIATATFRFM